MFNRNRALAAWLAAIVLLSGAAIAAHAQSAIVNTHKPFTLKVRYGNNADPAAPNTDGSKSRRIETTMAELDSEHIETRDARLQYWFDATGDSGDMALSVDFTYAIAQGQLHAQTRLLMRAGEWKRVAVNTDSDTGTDAVFVRVDRN